MVGGAGYVGSHTVQLLRTLGCRVTVLDDLSTGHAAAVPDDVELIRGDLRDADLMDAVLARVRPAGVLHFAALAVVGESVRDPAPTYDVNVNGTRVLLDALRLHGMPPIVFSSTCAIFGEPLTPTLAEDHPFAPVSPYGRSKLQVEHMLGDYAAAYGQPFTALRYFNAAGASDDGRLGEDHEPETHLIPIVLDVAAGRRDALTLFGDDWDTRDGTCVRDYVHVLDLADAHARALGRLQAGGESCRLNLGTGHGATVREVVRAVEDVTGQPVACRAGPRRDGDPCQLVADPHRAREALGWEPARTLRDCVASAARFRSRNPRGFEERPSH